MDPNLPILSFESKTDFIDWLEINNKQFTGIWIQIGKKNSGLKSVTYDEAVEASLCFGWIDGIKKAYDEKTFIQYFTPRRPKSIWSLINKEKAIGLIEQGEMRLSGFAAIEVAKNNGMWANAYEPQSTISIPHDLEQEFQNNKAAARFFKTLDSQNRYAILHRIQKTKTEDKRYELIQKFITMLEENKKLY